MVIESVEMTIVKERFFLTVFIMTASVVMSYIPVNAANERDPFVSILDQEKQEEQQKKLLIEEEKLTQEKAKKALSVVLNGIIWSDSKAVAIMNDELFSVGDEVEGYRIKSIEKNVVILSWDKIQRKLFLEDDTREKPPAKGKKTNLVEAKDESPKDKMPSSGDISYGNAPVSPEYSLPLPENHDEVRALSQE